MEKYYDVSVADMIYQKSGIIREELLNKITTKTHEEPQKTQKIQIKSKKTKFISIDKNIGKYIKVVNIIKKLLKDNKINANELQLPQAITMLVDLTKLPEKTIKSAITSWFCINATLHDNNNSDDTRNIFDKFSYINNETPETIAERHDLYKKIVTLTNEYFNDAKKVQVFLDYLMGTLKISQTGMTKQEIKKAQHFLQTSIG